jgi:hypothetical protein
MPGDGTFYIVHQHGLDGGAQQAPLTRPGSVSLNAATEPQAGHLPNLLSLPVPECSALESLCSLG